MQITITAGGLKKALDRLHRIVDKKNTIVVLSMILIETDDEAGTLRLSATDLDLQAQITLQAPGTELTVSGKESVLMPAHLLRDVVSKYRPEDIVRIAWEGAKETQATISSGRSRFKLFVLPASDFPELRAVEAKHSFSLSGSVFRSAVQDVFPSISTEETRYYLNGIYMHPDEGGKLALVATDGHRLALRKIELPSGAAGAPGVIIPRKAISEIVALAELAGDGPIEVSLNESRISVRVPGIELVSRLVDGTFPDYRRVIPASSNQSATFKTAELARTIDRVATICSEKTRAIKATFSEGGQVEIRIRDSDGSDAVEELDASYSGPEFSIGFNARYMIEHLSGIARHGASVNIDMKDPGSPMRITAEGAEDLLLILMPMRV